MEYLFLQWHITDCCAQRCEHCYIYGTNPDKQPESMPLDKMLKVVDRCLDYAADKKLFFTILGGDPLLHPNFWNLAEYLKSKGIMFAILGNPDYLTQANCLRLKKCGCISYQVSIDGMRETHDAIRRPGSFDATVKNISLLQRFGISTAIMTTVTQANMDEVLDIIDLAVKLKVNSYAFTRYAPTDVSRPNLITPVQYRDFLDKVYKKYEEHRNSGCRTYLEEKEHLFTLYRFENGLEYKDRHCCTIGLSGCILPDGTLQACRRVPGTEVGNILDGYPEDKLLEFRDATSDEGCGQCELAPWCRGCHAVSKGQYGDFHARDPQCWKENGFSFNA